MLCSGSRFLCCRLCVVVRCCVAADGCPPTRPRISQLHRWLGLLVARQLTQLCVCAAHQPSAVCQCSRCGRGRGAGVGLGLLEGLVVAEGQPRGSKHACKCQCVLSPLRLPFFWHACRGSLRNERACTAPCCRPSLECNSVARKQHQGSSGHTAGGSSGAACAAQRQWCKAMNPGKHFAVILAAIPCDSPHLAFQAFCSAFHSSASVLPSPAFSMLPMCANLFPGGVHEFN